MNQAIHMVDILQYLMGPIGGGISNPAAISFETHARNISAFIDAVESGKPFVFDARESRKAVEIILAIYSSAREMKPYYF